MENGLPKNASPGFDRKGPAARFSLLLVIAAVLLLRLPFLDQAIQGDDFNYLVGAQHAQIDPLHPNHVKYVFLGETVDMRGHPHPPLNAWFLGALLAVYGDVYEVPFHGAYLLFSLIAALAMRSLADRFSPRPLLATLLFLVTPAFVVNGTSLESDLPLLAFWMASAALFVRAVEERSRRALLSASLCMALTALAAYQAVVLIPILAAYLLIRRREWAAGWLAILTPAIVLGAWQVFERMSTGALPAGVLTGYFETYGLQSLQRKLLNAGALTAHAGWILFPVLTLAAFRRTAKWIWAVAAGAAGAAAFIDPHPIFWFSFGAGVLLLGACTAALAGGEHPAQPGAGQTMAARLRERAGSPDFWLAAWVLIFFAASLAIFFAGAARYLLPMAAPVAILATRRLSDRPRILWAGIALQLLVSLGLAQVNYRHWGAYQHIVQRFEQEFERKRVWINGEWGLRHYAEAAGGLPLVLGQAVRPGEMMISSTLAYPVPLTTGGGQRVLLAEAEIRPRLPFRLIALNSRSAYSTASPGALRPFDLSTGPIDRVRAEAVVARKPTLSFLAMNDRDADNHVISGLYSGDNPDWRWTADRAVFLLAPPAQPGPLSAAIYLPDAAPARRITLIVNSATVAEKLLPGPGSYTIESERPLEPTGESLTVTIVVDQTFSAPGDGRRLGVILSSVGFRR